MTAFSIDEQTRRTLSPYGFDEQALSRLAERLKQPGQADNAVKGQLTPPAPEDVTVLPKTGTAERKALAELGRAAIAKGEVGAVILAGGMATRFGGVVKAVVPVTQGKTFLQIKLDDIDGQAKASGGSVPTYLMTSFATHQRITEVVKGTKVEAFPQFVSLRLRPDGTLFTEKDGTLSPYAPGHGDLSFALRRSGVLQKFRSGGGKLLYMSNVDNLGATLDPAVIGAHVKRGAKITCEVVRKVKGDKGGAPARINGVPQIVEAFRFPPAFDQDQIPVFNTNSFVLDAEAIDRDFDLPFYKVEKKVDGQTAIQFERLVGELTAFLPTAFLEVERDGADARFLPVKDPEELQQRLPLIEQLVKAKRYVG